MQDDDGNIFGSGDGREDISPKYSNMWDFLFMQSEKESMDLGMEYATAF